MEIWWSMRNIEGLILGKEGFGVGNFNCDKVVLFQGIQYAAIQWIHSGVNMASRSAVQ